MTVDVVKTSRGFIDTKGIMSLDGIKTASGGREGGTHGHKGTTPESVFCASFHTKSIINSLIVTIM